MVTRSGRICDIIISIGVVASVLLIFAAIIVDSVGTPPKHAVLIMVGAALLSLVFWAFTIGCVSDHRMQAWRMQRQMQRPRIQPNIDHPYPDVEITVVDNDPNLVQTQNPESDDELDEKDFANHPDQN